MIATRTALAALSILAFVLFVTPVSAQAPTVQAPCSAPEYRQFDFWLGEWEVQNPQGQVVGKNGHVITSIRSLVTALGGKHKCRVELDFVTEQDKEFKGGRRGGRDERRARPTG